MPRIYAEIIPIGNFCLTSPEDSKVNKETVDALKEEGVLTSLEKTMCIDVSLRTNDGEGMLLEVWTLKLIPDKEPTDMGLALQTIYYRMGVMLKSALTISRVTPAYKLSRKQHKENYTISHKIYSGEPNLNLLGEQYKVIKISELKTVSGTIVFQVVHRMKMTIVQENQLKPAVPAAKPEAASPATEIMVKSDHFVTESPKRAQTDKKEIDLSKPLTRGAFVDEVKIRELHDALSQQLPPEPPMTWLLAENDKLAQKMKELTTAETASTSDGPSTSAAAAAADRASTSDAGEKPGCSSEAASSNNRVASKAIEVPRAKNGDKYSSLMDFAFADGSPMAELANFYHECVQARSVSDEWTDLAGEISQSTDSDSLSQQLKMFEDAVPEFDSMVASMMSNSENSED
ncbi:autophagy-related protein 13 homolog isoform X2 [Amyelois transitella]|uniref:autophagy-related protein 13 homolog isoform X2 n=1 Tax=Amyelois transitella TaxID=680683 RepID=UPI00067D725D|nr:autophagy-related protein 13 homolog isoform X2 [Amyelois transitella]